MISSDSELIAQFEEFQAMRNSTFGQPQAAQTRNSQSRDGSQEFYRGIPIEPQTSDTIKQPTIGCDAAISDVSEIRQALRRTYNEIADLANCVGELEARLDFVMKPLPDNCVAATPYATYFLSNAAKEVDFDAEAIADIRIRVLNILARLSL